MFKSNKKAFQEKAMELQKQLDQNYLKSDQTIEKGQGLNREHYQKVMAASPGRNAKYIKKCNDFCVDFIAFSANNVFREAAKIAINSGKPDKFVKMMHEEYNVNPSSFKRSVGLRLTNQFINTFIK